MATMKKDLRQGATARGSALTLVWSASSHGKPTRAPSTANEPGKSEVDVLRHLPPWRLFQRVGEADLEFGEQAHLVACRSCRLLADAASAAILALRASGESSLIEEIEPRKAYERASQSVSKALDRIQDAGVLGAPQYRLFEAECRIWLEGLRDLDEKDPHAPLLMDLPALLAEPVPPDVEPDDSIAERAGFARVVFQGVDGVPIFGLLKTREDGGAHKLRVLVPSALLPAISPSLLSRADAIHRRSGEHVLLLDLRSAGWTRWWSPHRTMTGGYVEGLDIASCIEDLLFEMGGRISQVDLRGFFLGGTSALWAQIHAVTAGRELGHKYRYVHALSPAVHAASALRSIESPRTSESLRQAHWRIFFSLLLAVRRADEPSIWGDVTSFVDMLAKAGVDVDGAATPGHAMDISRVPRNRIPCDLMFGARALAQSQRMGAKIEIYRRAAALDKRGPIKPSDLTGLLRALGSRDEDSRYDSELRERSSVEPISPPDESDLPSRATLRRVK